MPYIMQRGKNIVITFFLYTFKHKIIFREVSNKKQEKKSNRWIVMTPEEGGAEKWVEGGVYRERRERKKIQLFVHILPSVGLQMYTYK